MDQVNKFYPYWKHVNLNIVHFFFPLLWPGHDYYDENKNKIGVIRIHLYL